jgi:DnaJ-class molecular chaperone
MQNYYQILGVSSAATPEELRRAYRILARRYHPDVNPGKSSEEKFKRIAEAYAELQDPVKRKAFDQELEKAHAESFTSSFDRAHEAYRRQQGFDRASAKMRKPPPGTTGATGRVNTASGSREQNINADKEKRGRIDDPLGSGPGGKFADSFFKIASKSHSLVDSIRRRIPTRKGKKIDTPQDLPSGTQVSQISIIEVSVSIIDAIRGLKKTVELNDGAAVKKISVTIPPGVRTGSVVRFRRKEGASEEVVLIVRVASHPILSMAQKGLIMEVPISVKEAIQGARIKVPTLEEQSTVFVDPGTQSGREVRLRGQGVQYRDGTKGDLFIRFMIRVPESQGAVGLAEAAGEFEKYHEKPVRHALPHNILDM